MSQPSLEGIREAADWLLAVAEGKVEDQGFAEYVGTAISDAAWLATVAICISDRIGDLEGAIYEVYDNRDFALKARLGGFEPSEVAQFALSKR